MIERDDHHVFRPTIKIGVKKIHSSPHVKSAVDAPLDGITIRVSAILLSSTNKVSK